MKKLFIKKLKKEGKLKLVESSTEISLSYLEKSERSFLSGTILSRNELYEDSISMFYYSMYNALLALLFRVGIKSENHSFSIYLLKFLFDRIDIYENIFSAKKERIDKQYYVNVLFGKKDVNYLKHISEDFNLEIKLILNSISLEGIKKLRNKFKELIK